MMGDVAGRARDSRALRFARLLDTLDVGCDGAVIVDCEGHRVGVAACSTARPEVEPAASVGEGLRLDSRPWAIDARNLTDAVSRCDRPG